MTDLLQQLLKPPRTLLTDDDVRLILELHNYHGLGYKKLAQKFECSVAAIQGICTRRRRRKPGSLNHVGYAGYAVPQKPVI